MSVTISQLFSIFILVCYDTYCVATFWGRCRYTRGLTQHSVRSWDTSVWLRFITSVLCHRVWHSHTRCEASIANQIHGADLVLFNFREVPHRCHNPTRIHLLIAGDARSNDCMVSGIEQFCLFSTIVFSAFQMHHFCASQLNQVVLWLLWSCLSLVLQTYERSTTYFLTILILSLGMDGGIYHISFNAAQNGIDVNLPSGLAGRVLVHYSLEGDLATR